MPPIKCCARRFCGHVVQPRAKGGGGLTADRIGSNATIEDEVAGFLDLQCLLEQIVELQYFDVPLPHLQDEVVVILLRLVHPDDVIEEQLTAVPRRQALVREARPTHHHGSQFPDF